MRAGLFTRVVSLEARKQMSYRVDFWINAVMGFVAELTIAYFLWAAIFQARGADRIGGFTFEGMALYYVAAILLAKLVRGQSKDLTIARDIYEGSLTRYLIYPCSYVLFKYAEHLGSLVPALLQTLVFGVMALFWMQIPGDVQIDSLSVAMALTLVVVANMLAFLLRFPIQGVAFWADNVWSLNVMLRLATELLGGLLLPLSLFPPAAQAFLAWLPFPYFFYVPVQTLFGRVSVGEWLAALGVMSVWCVVIGAIGAMVWRRGHRVYTGVGI